MSNFIDLTGRTYGELFVIKHIGTKSGNTRYLCRCLLCGKEFEIGYNALKIQTRCKECSFKHNTLDITGRRYGRLIAIRYDKTVRSRQHWLFKCDCGKERVLSKISVVNARTKSCGCLNIESRFRHKMAYTLEYKVWSSMISRTTDKNNHAADRYINRGITVCDEWRHSFEQFHKDMGERPSGGYTLERIDNDGNYEPSNCRWATRMEQSNNKSSNRIIDFEGTSYTIANLARKLNIRYSMFFKRLKAGWTIEKIIKTPSMRTKKSIHP